MASCGPGKEMKGVVAADEDSTIEDSAKDGEESFRRGSLDLGV